MKPLPVRAAGLQQELTPLIFLHLQDKQQKPVVLQQTNSRVLTVDAFCGFVDLNVSQSSAAAAGRVLHVPAACWWIRATPAAAQLQRALMDQKDKMQSVRLDQHRFFIHVTAASPPEIKTTGK